MNEKEKLLNLYSDLAKECKMIMDNIDVSKECFDILQQASFGFYSFTSSYGINRNIYEYISHLQYHNLEDCLNCILGRFGHLIKISAVGECCLMSKQYKLSDNDILFLTYHSLKQIFDLYKYINWEKYNDVLKNK